MDFTNIVEGFAYFIKIKLYFHMNGSTGKDFGNVAIFIAVFALVMRPRGEKVINFTIYIPIIL